MWGQQLFKARIKEDPNDKTWFFLKMSNKVKYNKGKGFRSMFGIEATYFLHIQDMGRILTFYANQMTKIEKPSAVIFMGSVKGFSRESQNKIRFEFKNGQNLDIQFEGKADIDKWATALNFFRQKQRRAPFGIDNWEEIEWTFLDYSNLDDKTKWVICKENEERFFDSIEKNFDHDEFIHDKGLGDMFSYSPMDTLKNRVLLSKAGFKENEKQVDFDPDFDENDFSVLENAQRTSTLKLNEKAQGFSGIMGDFMARNDHFLLLVSNIPVANVDQHLFERDQLEVNQEDLNVHHEVELYCIYVYEYKGKGDYRGAVNHIDLDSLEYAYIEPTLTNTFRICIGNSTSEYSLTFTTACEAFHWLEGIRRCMEIAKRAGKIGMQKFIQTVKVIYNYLGQGSKLEIKKVLDNILLDNFQKIEEARQRALDEAVLAHDLVAHVKDMKGQVREAVMEIDFFLDAFVNHHTFNEQLFMFIVYRFGGTMRYFLACYWLVIVRRLDSLNESLEFVNVLNLYMEMMAKWKISDSQLERCRATVCHSISSQAFQSSKKAVTNLILSIFQPAKEINGRFQMTFLMQAFGHFNFLTNTCCKFGDRFPEVKAVILETIRRLIDVVFVQVLTELEHTELDMEQNMALCQSGGMEEFRKFVKNFCGYTNLPPKEVRKGLNEDYFDRCIIKLETIGFDNFTRILQLQFEEMLGSYAKGVFTFDVSFFLNDFLQEYEDLLDSADADQRESIMARLLAIFHEKYFLNICDNSRSISKKNVDLLLDRIEGDAEIIKAFFQLYITEDLGETEKLFDELEFFILAEDYESTVISLLNFHSLFPQIVDSRRIGQLANIKVFFSPLVIQKVNAEFTAYFSKKESKMRVHENLDVIVNVSSPIVHEFIKVIRGIYERNMKFKQLVAEKREAFAYMYEENAYQLMLSRGRESTRVAVSKGIDAGSRVASEEGSRPDSMRFVKVGMTIEDEIVNEWGNKIFELEFFILPAVSNWAMLEAKFKSLRREGSAGKRVFLRFDQEVVQLSSDFFGQKGISIFNYRMVENLRKVGSHGFSFTFGQKCLAFFILGEKKQRARTKATDADKFLTLVQNRMDILEKDVYEGVNLHRIKELNLTDQLGEFELEIKQEDFVYDFQAERDNMLKEGQKIIGKGRKESVELEEDLF